MIDKDTLKQEIENYYLDLISQMDEFSIKRTTKNIPTQDVREMLILYEAIFSWIEKTLNENKLDAETKIFCMQTIIELFNGGSHNE